MGPRGVILARTMKAVNVARVLLLAGMAAAGIASTTSSQNNKPAVNNPQSGQPQPSAMDPAKALGLWKSSFGAVKVEPDDRGAQGAIHGVWVYDRNGQEV